MRALLAGRLEQADQLASQALAAGAHGETVTAPQYYATQLLAIRREQGRIAELEQPAREMVKSNPTRVAWRAGLATLLWEAGRAEQARVEFETLAAHEFADIQQDGDWMISMTLLADTCAELGDSERAAWLYEQLLPYRESNVVIGLAAVCLGAAARHLGLLAATMGRLEEASEHFDRALVANSALQAPVCLAHTQLDYARMLGPTHPKASLLIDAAALTAEELGLPMVARRVAELRER